MGSECCGLSKASASPSRKAEPPLERLRLRGPDGLLVQVAGDATVADVLAATRASGRPARALKFCDEPVDPSARLVDLGIYDDAEFGVASCAHWRLRLTSGIQQPRGILSCPDCDAISASTTGIGFFTKDSNERASFCMSIFARSRGDRIVVTSLPHHVEESDETIDLLRAWWSADTPEAIAVCQHPVRRCPHRWCVACCKCGAQCRIDAMIARPLGDWSSDDDD